MTTRGELVRGILVIQATGRIEGNHLATRSVGGTARQISYYDQDSAAEARISLVAL